MVVGSPKFALDWKCKDSPGTVPSYFSDWLTVRLEFYFIFLIKTQLEGPLTIVLPGICSHPSLIPWPSLQKDTGPATAHIDWEAGDELCTLFPWALQPTSLTPEPAPSTPVLSGVTG